MPSPAVHFAVAKKVNPNAAVDFYFGSIAPDCVANNEWKNITHMRDALDMGEAIKTFASKIDIYNEYVKGMILHLFVDWKWINTILSDYMKKTGEEWYKKYFQELVTIESFMFYHENWVRELWEQLDSSDIVNFVETECITKEFTKSDINRVRKVKIERFQNQLEDNIDVKPSSEFTPTMIDKFVNDTAADFIEWFSDLIS